jgi:hypothetical protein
MSNLTDMEKEIGEAELFIKGLQAEGGFSVPENYFEKLQDRIEFVGDDVIIEEELNDIKSISSEGGFSMPPEYLETLEGKVMNRVLEVNNEAKVVSLFPFRNYWLASMAATFLIAAIIFLWKDQKSELVVESSRLEIEQVADHLEVGDLNEDLLCDAGWCDEITSLPGIGGDIPMEYLNETETDLLIEEL